MSDYELGKRRIDAGAHEWGLGAQGKKGALPRAWAVGGRGERAVGGRGTYNGSQGGWAGGAVGSRGT